MFKRINNWVEKNIIHPQSIRLANARHQEWLKRFYIPRWKGIIDLFSTSLEEYRLMNQLDGNDDVLKEEELILITSIFEQNLRKQFKRSNL